MVNVRGYEIKNLPSEMTVKEWEKLMEYTGRKVFDPEKPEEPYYYEDITTKWEEILVLRGLPEKELETMEEEEFGKYVNEFNTQGDKKMSLDNPVKEFELDGVKYTASGFEDGEFKIYMPKQKLIREFMKEKPNKCIAEMIAVIFHKDGLGDAEHKSVAHIRRKAKLFREKLNAGITVPYIIFVAKKKIAYSMALQKKAKDEADANNSDELGADNA